jgi:predicted DNA-binding ribbon-helix-helix protein
MIKKRSIKIAGHKTSVSLEEDFWDALKAIAAAEGVSLSALVERTDAARADKAGADNLSSALRLYALAHLRAKAGI